MGAQSRDVMMQSEKNMRAEIDIIRTNEGRMDAAIESAKGDHKKYAQDLAAHYSQYMKFD